MADGRSSYDALGPWYTLVRFDTAVAIGALEAAARRCGLPLAVLDLCDETPPPGVRHPLVLVRPDQHVAWRGDREPANAAGLVDLLRGARI